jgi:hypothetical protein
VFGHYHRRRNNYCDVANSFEVNLPASNTAPAVLGHLMLSLFFPFLNESKRIGPFPLVVKTEQQGNQIMVRLEGNAASLNIETQGLRDFNDVSRDHLGYPFAKQLASQLGGEIAVLQDQGRSTGFEVRLPAAPTSAPLIEMESIERAQAILEAARATTPSDHVALPFLRIVISHLAEFGQPGGLVLLSYLIKEIDHAINRGGVLWEPSLAEQLKAARDSLEALWNQICAVQSDMIDTVLRAMGAEEKPNARSILQQLHFGIMTPAGAANALERIGIQPPQIRSARLDRIVLRQTAA